MSPEGTSPLFGRNEKRKPSLAVVTGGCGFIGTHLVSQLVEAGYRVKVLDLTANPALDRRAELIEGSILNRGLVRKTLTGADRLFHLAADPNLWSPDKTSFDRVNHQGTRVVLEEAARADISRIVHTSTESILKGRRGGHPGAIDETLDRTLEDMPGPYCRSKFLAERAALEAAARGQHIVIVNPTLPVGPGDTKLTPPSRMILDFLNGKNPAYLDFETNMIDVRDAARGHILAAERGVPGQRYILGGENVMLSQVLLILREITGLRMPRTRIPYLAALGIAAASELIADHITRKAPRASLTGVRVAGAEMIFDCSKARRELGLTPRPTRESLAEAIGWFLQQGLVERPLPRPVYPDETVPLTV